MRIIEVYGLSEACAISFANTVHDVRLGTVGKILPGMEYKLAEDGEILLRGPTVFSKNSVAARVTCQPILM